MNAFECAVRVPPRMSVDVYKLHKELWGLISPQQKSDGGKRGYVYRLINAGSDVVALIRIEEGWTTALHPGLPIKEVHNPMSLGAKMVITSRLETYANSRDGNGKKKLVVPSDLTEWARKLYERNGLHVSGVEYGAHEQVKHDKPGQKCRLSMRDFRVHAEVVDEALAQNAWLLGMGRGKAYGAGMLVCGAQNA